MSSLRGYLSARREAFKKASFAVSGFGARYLIPGGAFSREHSAVALGIAHHHRLTRLGKEKFALRRRLHMLEKGLSMRPRRDTFGEAYILETIERLRATTDSAALDNETRHWASDVLEAYFEATAASGSPAVRNAELLYRSLSLAPSAAPRYLGPSAYGTPAAPIGIVELRQLADQRRSVRWFTPEVVDRQLIDNAIEIAQTAPTACNRVPYRFLVFTGEDAHAVAGVAMGTAGYAHNVPGVIVIVGDLSAYSDERDRHLIYIDSSLAAMGLLLALQAQGVASCCINWPDLRLREQRMAALINLKPYERVIMLVAYGIADPEGIAPGSGRMSLDSIRSFETLAGRSTNKAG